MTNPYDDSQLEPIILWAFTVLVIVVTIAVFGQGSLVTGVASWAASLVD